VSVQSTDTDDFRRRWLLSGDGVQEQMQEALQTLEGFLAGELSTEDAEALLDMEDITPDVSFPTVQSLRGLFVNG